MTYQRYLKTSLHDDLIRILRSSFSWASLVSFLQTSFHSFFRSAHTATHKLHRTSPTLRQRLDPSQSTGTHRRIRQQLALNPNHAPRAKYFADLQLPIKMQQISMLNVIIVAYQLNFPFCFYLCRTSAAYSSSATAIHSIESIFTCF